MKPSCPCFVTQSVYQHTNDEVLRGLTPPGKFSEP